MKTLDQVEPRIPIDATHTPGDATSVFKITQGGSYYLTGNITGVAGKNGILVQASDVTLDLMGHNLIGVASSLNGISLPGFISNLAIRNGTVRGWGGTGIEAVNTGDGRYEDLGATFNTGPGIRTGGGVIQRCTATSNRSHGFQVGTGTTVRGCTSEFNSGDGFSPLPSGSSSCTFADCVAYQNGGNGIVTLDASTLTNCAAADNLGAAGISLGNGSSATGCTSTFNQNSASGIVGGTGCSVAHCVVTDNNGAGINLSTGANIQSCVARNNRVNTGIRTGDNSVVKDCTSEANNGATTKGFSLGANCTIIGCTAAGNTAIGIQTSSDSTIKDCTVQGNTGDGIQAVDRCQIIACNSNGNGSGVNGSGIVGGVRTVVRHCNAAENQKSGIIVSGASLVSENYVGHNGLGVAAAGIDSNNGGTGSGSRIEANQARNNNGTGILGASNDVIIRNYSFSNTTNYNPASGANFGPIELPSTSTHPSANF